MSSLLEYVAMYDKYSNDFYLSLTIFVHFLGLDYNSDEFIVDAYLHILQRATSTRHISPIYKNHIFPYLSSISEKTTRINENFYKHISVHGE